MTDPDAEPLVLRSRIPASAAGQTLLAFLTARFRYHSRAAWLAELRAQHLQLDGRAASGDEILRPGMRLSYEKQHREPAVDASWSLLHRDAALLAIAKPAHLPMHADGPFIRNTLIHLLREQLALPGLQLVHRLDRETSGVCIVACDKTVQAAVQAQFVAGTIEKTYVAIVEGIVEQPFVAAEAIGHAAASSVRLRRSAAADARHPQAACTEFEPLDHGPHRTLLRCRPRTGRTHQIRVHLEAHGHAIVGDKLYGHPDQHYLDFVHRMKAGASVFTAGDGQPNRHLLHAQAMRFDHPLTGNTTRYEAPVPAEFEAWLRR